MTDNRPVLVGMNNPHSLEPRHALAPYPAGVAGHRLYTMMCEHEPLGRREYMNSFDRRNLILSREWDMPLARASAPALWSELEGRTVLLLGRSVLSALRLNQPPPMIWQVPADALLRSPGPARWCYVPHPSGRNQWYNNPDNRRSVGRFLTELVQAVVPH